MDDSEYMFFDKTHNGDHSYEHESTKNITIEELFGSDYKYLENDKAVSEFNKDPANTQKLPTKFDKKLYNIYLFKYDKFAITIISVNKKILHKYVIDKVEIPNKDFLSELCRYHIVYTRVLTIGKSFDDLKNKTKTNETISNITKKAILPNSDPTDPIEPQPSYALTPLYLYQRRSIKWMLTRERNYESIYYNMNDEIQIGDILYDAVRQEFVPFANRAKLNFRGGALVDEVGLGKTYQMIVMSLSNQAKNINYIQDKFTKLFSKATLVICPSNIAGQWTRELQDRIDKKYNLKILQLFTKVHFDKHSYQDLLDADFVIVSFSFLSNRCFLDNWLNNISTNKNYLSSGFYSKKMCCDELDKLSKNMYINPTILEKFPNILLIHWHRIIVDEFHEIFTVKKYSFLQNLIELFSGTYKWCMTATPFDKSSDCLINMVNFVTNYENSNSNSNDIFLNKNICDHINNFFFRRNTKQSIKSEYQLPELKESIIWLNFSRTEWAIYNAYLANASVDKFSVLVRQICCYPKLAEEIKIILSNCKTMEDIEKMMVKHYEAQMNASHKKVKLMEYRIKKHNYDITIAEWKRQRKLLKPNYKVIIKFTNDFEEDDELIKLDKDLQIFKKDPFDDDSDDESDNKKEKIIISDETQEKIKKLLSKTWHVDFPQYLTKMYEKIPIYQNDLKTLIKEYEGKKTTFEYFSNVIKKIRNAEKKHIKNDSGSESDSDEDEKCGVCMGSITGADLGVIKCGHIYCYNCVKPFIDKQHKCPTCQCKVLSSEIYMIAKKEKETVDENFKDKVNLINKIGTKLANLIFFLKKHNDHTIIFSQWSDLLSIIGDVLDSHGIKNVFCKGNVWQRDKAIREFNTNDKIKVIMLSSESAASGTNLTRAKRVILIDPVYGTYEQRRNTEWQAIGRAYRMGQTANVEVVRFVIRSSIEEEIYNMNKIENQKFNEELKIFETSGDNLNLEADKIKEINNAVINIKTKKKANIVKKIAKNIAKTQENVPIIEDIEEDDED